MFDIVWRKKLGEVKSFCLNDNLSFFVKNLDKKYNYKIRLKGEVGVPKFDRTEYRFPLYYRKLEDSLVRHGNEYALEFSSYNFNYERSCYSMIRGIEKDTPYTFSYKYKAKNKKGKIKISLEFYYGENKTRYYYESADKEIVEELENADEFTERSLNFTCDKKVDFVMLKISGVDYDGEAQVFTPSISDGKKELVSKFAFNPTDILNGEWIGEGFSLTERPYFEVIVNNEVIFEGRKRDRLNSFAGVEFDIPETVLKSENEIEIVFGNEKGVQYPYLVSEIQIISTPKEFEILGALSYQAVNKPFGILCYSNEDCSVEVKGDGIEYLGGSLKKGKATVIKVVATKSLKDGRITLTANGKKRDIFITATEKEEDNVLTGTGDFIYVGQNEREFTEYLAWYLTNNVGNMLTFRSAYRWGVTSELDERFWKFAKNTLTDLGIYYCLMCDGRELNGARTNPPKEWMESPYFLGEQTHEKDGSFIYWAQDLTEFESLFNHLFSRKLDRNGIHMKNSPVYGKDGKSYWSITGYDYDNLKDAKEKFQESIKYTIKDGATRHTGVTPQFNEFFKAGYKWVGYESMYGPHELLLGAVRGVSRSNNQTEYGTHLALQWSTTPCDDEKHKLRYRLSLYESYMHGVSQINTEEGLWTMETGFTDFDRFSKPCVEHTKEQSEFYKYIATHTRKGVQKPDIAMIIGNCDYFDCFSAGKVLGQKGEEWKYASPEDSWNLLKVFYPQADLNSIYYFIVKGGREKADEKYKKAFEFAQDEYRDITDYKSLGFYSTTPYGAIDIISADANNFNDYKCLFFTGWNTCDGKLLEKLIDFVEKGGTLLLSKVHLYDSYKRKEVLGGKGKVIDSPLVEKLLSYKDNVIYFDEDKFPIDIEGYKDKLSELGRRFGSKYITNADNVSFTEYTDGDITTIYLLDINWWNNDKSSVILTFNGKEKKITLPKNKLCYITVDNKNKQYKLYRG